MVYREIWYANEFSILIEKYFSELILSFTNFIKSSSTDISQSVFLIILLPPFLRIILCLFLNFCTHPLVKLQLVCRFIFSFRYLALQIINSSETGVPVDRISKNQPSIRVSISHPKKWFITWPYLMSFRGCLFFLRTLRHQVLNMIVPLRFLSCIWLYMFFLFFDKYINYKKSFPKKHAEIENAL